MFNFKTFFSLAIFSTVLTAYAQTNTHEKLLITVGKDTYEIDAKLVRSIPNSESGFTVRQAVKTNEKQSTVQETPKQSRCNSFEHGDVIIIGKGQSLYGQLGGLNCRVDAVINDINHRHKFSRHYVTPVDPNKVQVGFCVKYSNIYGWEFCENTNKYGVLRDYRE